MRTIWKAILDLQDVQNHGGHAICKTEMPMGSKVIMVKEQFDNICVWYQCDSLNKKEVRSFEIVGTGHECPRHGDYLGSAVLQGGNYVFHIFEVV